MEFLERSKALINRKIVQFSFSTDDTDQNEQNFNKLLFFSFDSELTMSKEISSFNNHSVSPPKFFDHLLFSQLKCEDREKLNQLFLNFIKGDILSPGFRSKNLIKTRKTRLRSHSFRHLDIERLMNVFSFRHLVQCCLRKIVWESTILLMEMREIYREDKFDNPFYEINISVIKTICDLMSQFFTSTIYELRHNKCKKIIDELENYERNYINKFKNKENLQNNSEDSAFFRGRTISPHYIKTIKSKNSMNICSSIDDIIPKYFRESENFIENHEVLIQTNSIKENKISTLRCFAKFRFILSELAHIIHYNSIPFELENYINPENELAYFAFFRPKAGKNKFFQYMMPSIEFSHDSFDSGKCSQIYFSSGMLYIYYNLRFLNEMSTAEQIENKRNTLENYFCWKAKKWIRPNGRKPSSAKIKCKICLCDISASFMNKHSELCMKKKQLINEIKNLQSHFSHYVTLSENIIRNQKTLYRIERSSYKKYKTDAEQFKLTLNPALQEPLPKHPSTLNRSSTVEIKNSVQSSFSSSNNLKKTCPIDKTILNSQPPAIKSLQNLNKLGENSPKPPSFLLPLPINHEEELGLEESFNVLDSPDFMLEYKDEQNAKEIKKMPSIFFKRAELREHKPLKILTMKAFSDFKDSSTSSDSETKVFAKTREKDEKTHDFQRKISKFKPPPLKDSEKIVKEEENAEDFEAEEEKKFESSVQSEKNMSISPEKTALDAEKSRKLRRKEKKLRETYYNIKLYMIIQKTAGLFAQNPLNTKLSLKIKETLKELEKYENRVKSVETVVHRNNYIQDLREYLQKHGVLQILLKEIEALECRELKDLSAKSKKSHGDKSFLHYDSDSNAKFIGTPPKRIKFSKSNRALMEDSREKLGKSSFLQSRSSPSEEQSSQQKPFSLQDKSPTAYEIPLKSTISCQIPQINSAALIPLQRTPTSHSHIQPTRQVTSELRPSSKKKQTFPTNPRFPDIFSPASLPNSKKQMDCSKNLSLRRKLREKTKKYAKFQDSGLKNLSLQKTESLFPASEMTINLPSPTGFKDLNEVNEVVQEEEEFLIEHFLNFHRGYYSDSYLTPNPQTFNENEASLSINDFECIRLINKGAFGRVWLVKRKSTQDFYAMKIVNILDHIINKKDTKFLEAESRIYEVITGDFVVKALFQFTHETFICFVTEYMLGGDFANLLNEYKCLDETVAKFYLAELVLAIESLHSANIIHRDLKPDNILLDAQGHIKLTDFGLSKLGITKQTQEIGSPKKLPEKLNYKLKLPIKFVESSEISGVSPEEERAHVKTLGNSSKVLTPLRQKSQKISSQNNNLSRRHRVIGTPDYIAPEILNASDNWMNSPSVDWWALGVMMFEFIVGVPPFNDEDRKGIFENILKLAIPWGDISIGCGEDCMSFEAADLIGRMLVLDPEKRITKNGAGELKKHPFFSGIQWDFIRESKAPIIPSRDLENIDALENDHRKKFTEMEKKDPFFCLLESKPRESDENLKKARRKAHELLPTPKENIGALGEANIQLAKEFYSNQRISSDSNLTKSPLFDEYAKQRRSMKKHE